MQNFMPLPSGLMGFPSPHVMEQSTAFDFIFRLTMLRTVVNVTSLGKNGIG